MLPDVLCHPKNCEFRLIYDSTALAAPQAVLVSVSGGNCDRTGGELTIVARVVRCGSGLAQEFRFLGNARLYPALPGGHHYGPAQYPNILLILVAGTLFGLLQGILAVSIADTLGAIACFWVGRTIARDRIKRWM
jgi:hypothetical protein